MTSLVLNNIGCYIHITATVCRDDTQLLPATVEPLITDTAEEFKFCPL
jgi:hypothetical protein